MSDLTDDLDWDKQAGLIPAVVQDATTSRVLMLGYMNKQALHKTQATGEVTFYSRSRSALWTKGETSGNKLTLVSIAADCDNDSLLVVAKASGPTCHEGTTSCFESGSSATTLDFLGDLEATIDHRIKHGTSRSYIARLVQQGPSRVAQKLGEEAVELAIAAATEDRQEIRSEGTDLLFHLMLLLRSHDLSLRDIVAELKKRHQSSNYPAPGPN